MPAKPLTTSCDNPRLSLLFCMTFPTTIASNFVLLTEATILSLINTIAFIWAGFLIFFGIMVTHDYGMGKNFIITLATIVGMVVIIFIVFLFTVLLADMVNFVTNIVTEVQFRT